MHPCSQEGHQEEDGCQQVEGSDPAPLLSAGEAASGMLHLIQGFLAQGRSGLTGASPVQGHKDD